MELHQLAVFTAAAEEGGFSRAARKLFISHSTVCRAVAELEDELGVRLMERGPHEMSLTPSGETLLAEAKKLLAAAEEAKEKVRASQ